MTQKTVTRKIPGGKLVRMDVRYTDQIEALVITGDFFLHPEETLDVLTAICKATVLPMQPDVLKHQLDTALTELGAQMIGVSSEDLVSILQEALS